MIPLIVLALQFDVSLPPSEVWLVGHGGTLIAGDLRTGRCGLGAGGDDRQTQADSVWQSRLVELLSNGAPGRLDSKNRRDQAALAIYRIPQSDNGVGWGWNTITPLGGSGEGTSGLRRRVLRSFAGGLCPPTLWTATEWIEYLEHRLGARDRELVVDYLTEWWTLAVFPQTDGFADSGALHRLRNRCVRRRLCTALVHFALGERGGLGAVTDEPAH